jgi:hypothetical protein
MLKLFIAAAIAGYEQGFTIPCLQLELAQVWLKKRPKEHSFSNRLLSHFGCSRVYALQRFMFCPQVSTQTANRPLAREEVDLRALWLGLVYMTLQQVFHPTRTDTQDQAPTAAAEAVAASVPADVRRKFNTFVYDCVNARQGGWTLQTLKLDDLLKRSGGSAQETGSESVEEDNQVAKPVTDPMEKAILGQSMRLVFLTLQCLDEAELASGKSVPKPNIPGI